MRKNVFSMESTPARKYSFLKKDGKIKFKILFPANLIVAKKLVCIFCQLPKMNK